MPDVNVRGRYRAFTYDGTTSLDFTSYSNNVSVIRRPNEISFVTLRQYRPAISTPFTSFEPGSAYVIVSREGDYSFDMGPYTRVDRLPSSLNVKSPQYYLGLDKNSITIPLSVYALSVNNPLSSVTGITYINGKGVSQSTVSVNDIKGGFQTAFTHFLPNSGYQLRNRVPYTFFAPLQSEMGNTWATGDNSQGQFAMGHTYSLSSIYTEFNNPSDKPFLAERMFGNWVKIVENCGSVLALSACGTKNKLFVCGRNDYGQLGLGYTSPATEPIKVFKNVPGNYLDICTGYHSMVVNELGELYVCGYNEYGQLGLGNTTPTYTFTRNPNFTAGSNPVEINTPSICVGAYHSLVRDQNGVLWTCGKNEFGQLGTGAAVGSISTTFVSVGNIGVGDIGASANASMYVSNGRMYVCGYNFYNDYSTLGSVNAFRIGVSNGWSDSYITTFTQEICGFNDITNLWVGGRGIFVKRSSQSVLWACGSNNWGGLGMTIAGTIPPASRHRIYADIRALAPTIIPSNTIYMFYPGLFESYKFSSSTITTPYWIDSTSFDLRTIVISNYNMGSTPYRPYINILPINCSSFNKSGFFSSTLIHDRSPAPTPTPTSYTIYPQTNGARVAHVVGRMAGGSSGGANRMLRVFYSDDFDNWTFDQQFANPGYHGIVYDPGSLGYGQTGESPNRNLSFISGCIPQGNAFTASCRTLYSFQGFTVNTPTYQPYYNYNLRVAKSNNIGYPDYSGTTFTQTVNLDQTDQYSPRFKSTYNTGCFWDNILQKMIVVYCKQYPDSLTQSDGFFAYTFDPVTNIASEPRAITSLKGTNVGIDGFYTSYYNNNNLIQKSPTGLVYIPFLTKRIYQQGVGNIGNIINVLTWDRNNYNNEYFPNYNTWTTLPTLTSNQPPGITDSWGYPQTMRVGFWRDGTPVLGSIYGRNPLDVSRANKEGNLYINRFSNGSWVQTPILLKERLPYFGGAGIYGTMSTFTGWYAPFDMFVHPLENILYIVYVVNVQEESFFEPARHNIRLMKVNQQGTVLSDVLIFDCATGGTPTNGRYYSYAAWLNMFYKSTDRNNFTPYFSVVTTPNFSYPPGPTTRIFKYTNGAFTNIFNANFSPMRDNSGNEGCTTMTIT